MHDVALGGFIDFFINAGKELGSLFGIGGGGGDKGLDGLSKVRLHVKIVHLTCAALFEVFYRCFTLRHLYYSLLWFYY